jgi:hypothetical protein
MAPGEKCEYQRSSRADASFHMLRFAAERLREFPNVEFIELPGNVLSPIANSSIDFVYSTVIFHASRNVGSLYLCRGGVPRSS